MRERGKFVFFLKKCTQTLPTAKQNSNKISGGNTPDPCFGAGKEEDGEVCFRSPKNVLTLSYSVGNAEFKNCSGGNTSGTPF